MMLILQLLLANCVILASFGTSGCTPKLVAVKSDPCAGWAPIYASKLDVLTDGTAKQILAHDLHGVQAGCWKRPIKK